MRRPKRFYRDFDVFAAELARAREAEGSLDAGFVSSLARVAGTSAVTAGVGGAVLGALGLAAGPFGLLGAAAVAGLAASREKSGRDKHQRRLQKARRAFQDLTGGGRYADDPEVREEIDLLFDALLHDEPLYF